MLPETSIASRIVVWLVGTLSTDGRPGERHASAGEPAASSANGTWRRQRAAAGRPPGSATGSSSGRPAGRRRRWTQRRRRPGAGRGAGRAGHEQAERHEERRLGSRAQRSWHDSGTGEGQRRARRRAAAARAPATSAVSSSILARAMTSRRCRSLVDRWPPASHRPRRDVRARGHVARSGASVASSSRVWTGSRRGRASCPPRSCRCPTLRSGCRGRRPARGRLAGPARPCSRRR